MPSDEVAREGVLASLRLLMLAFLPVAAVLQYFVHSDPVWISSPVRSRSQSWRTGFAGRQSRSRPMPGRPSAGW